MKKEQAEIEFADATQELIKQQQCLNQYEQALQEGMKQYYQLAKEKVTIAELMSYTTYFDRINNQIEEKRNQVETCKEKRDECLAFLRVAMNKLKTIEQLKERKFEQFQEEQLAEEQKELDEIGLQIYTRMVR